MSELSEKLAVAYHEAGHAVAYYILRIPIKYVTIKPDPEAHTLGEVQGLPFPKSLAPDVQIDLRTRDYLERRIMGLAAGAIAEAMVTGERDHIGATEDMQRCLDFASYYCSDAEVSAYINWLCIRAEQLIQSPEHRRMLDEVADALVKKETISGRKARQIMNNARESFFKADASQI